MQCLCIRLRIVILSLFGLTLLYICVNRDRIGDYCIMTTRLEVVGGAWWIRMSWVSSYCSSFKSVGIRQLLCEFIQFKLDVFQISMMSAWRTHLFDNQERIFCLKKVFNVINNVSNFCLLIITQTDGWNVQVCIWNWYVVYQKRGLNALH